jgi:hypothetical protein
VAHVHCRRLIRLQSPRDDDFSVVGEVNASVAAEVDAEVAVSCSYPGGVEVALVCGGVGRAGAVLAGQGVAQFVAD